MQHPLISLICSIPEILWEGKEFLISLVVMGFLAPRSWSE